MRPFIIPALLACCAIAIAAPNSPKPDQLDSPHSTAAKSALIRANKDKAHAVAAYKKVMADTLRQLIHNLADARETILRGGGSEALAEGNRIQACIDEANRELALNAGQQFKISAARGWQPTINVSAGQNLRLAAYGTWCAGVKERSIYTCGPDGKPFGKKA